MEFLTNLWNNQPTTVMGIGAAIIVLLEIYLCEKYAKKSVSNEHIRTIENNTILLLLRL